MEMVAIVLKAVHGLPNKGLKRIRNGDDVSVAGEGSSRQRAFPGCFVSVTYLLHLRMGILPKSVAPLSA